MTAKLFSEITLRGLTLNNRIAVAPMCQYSADKGNPTDWHRMHMAKFSVCGAGLFIAEATAVLPAGRITDVCLGLYSDEQEANFRHIIDFFKRYGQAAPAIQLSHAGRKASTQKPLLGIAPSPLDQGGWQPLSVSGIALQSGWPKPKTIDRDDMDRIRDAFVAAALRADRIGFQLLELHGAHGYLIHEFLSPISNHRSDTYGGSFENRIRFPVEVFEAVRTAWPDDKPLGVRVSATDWVDGGWTPDETVALTRILKQHGCDYIHVSSGGIAPGEKIPMGPGYQVKFAQQIREAAGITTIAVGQIIDPFQAEHIIRTGQADMVALGRPMLFNPHWAWQAACALGEPAAYARQYERGDPSVWRRFNETRPTTTKER